MFSSFGGAPGGGGFGGASPMQTDYEDDGGMGGMPFFSFGGAPGG